MTECKISLRNLKDTDYIKLYNWCQNEYVYKWFEQRKLSYNEIVNKYQTKLKDDNQKLFIIKCNNIDIGYTQIYKYINDINLPLYIYKNIYEFDLFIGENNYLSKGIGKIIINKICETIYKKYNADAIILRVFKENIRAIKCYEKCNFKKIYEYIGEDTLKNKQDIIVFANDKMESIND